MDYLNDVTDLLFSYQIPHVDALVDILQKHPCALNGSDPGTGKTYATAALCRRLRRRAFVVCPKSVVESWFDVLSVFDVEIIGISNYESIRVGKYYESIDMFLDGKRVECPYLVRNDGFHWDLPDDTLFIFDEAHKGKNKITCTAEMMLSMREVLDKNMVKMVILSATITDSVDNFHTAAVLLGLAQEGKHAYRAWLKTLHVEDGEIIAAIHKLVYPEYGARMRIRDLQNSADEIISQIFKNNDVQAIVEEIEPEKELEIIAAYEQIDAALDALKNKQIHDTHPLVMLTRAWQKLEMLRVPVLIEHAMERTLNERNVVIFVNFNETINLLFKPLDEFVQKEFNSFITIIKGGQSAKDRKYNVDMFNNDSSRLMISNGRAGGLGISLHAREGRRPRDSLISPPTSASDLKQILGRIHRAGAASGVEQRIIYCKGKTLPIVNKEGKINDTTFTVNNRRIGAEELLADALNKKLRTIEWFNNGNEDDLIPI